MCIMHPLRQCWFNVEPISEAQTQYYFFQREDCLYMSKSDVCRRQILTYKDGPRTKRIKIFILAVDP